MDYRLSDIQTDALREAETIGAGNAATALSKLVGMGIGVNVPDVNVLSLESATEALGPKEEMVTAVYHQLLGDADGVLLYAFKNDDALKLADLLLHKPVGYTKLLNEMGRSAVKEAATILCGAFLSSLSSLLKMQFLMSTPALAQDMAGAIIGAVLAEAGETGEHAIVVNTQISITKEKLSSYFMFIPDAHSLKKMLKSLGV